MNELENPFDGSTVSSLTSEEAKERAQASLKKGDDALKEACEELEIKHYE